MNTLKEHVSWKFANTDKLVATSGYPLVLKNCKKNKTMRTLKLYGSTQGIGELMDDERYKISLIQKGKNMFYSTEVSASDSANPTLMNSYGTTLDSTDFNDGKITVMQTSFDDSNIASYINGIVYIFVPYLSVGKTYTVSFDIEILNNLGSVDTLGILGNGVSQRTSNVITSDKQRIYFTTPLTDVGTEVSKNYFQIRCKGMSFTLSNFMATEVGHTIEYEPYEKPIYHDIYLNSPLGENEYIDFKQKKVFRTAGDEDIVCELPKLTSKTTIFETDTLVFPSSMYGKYVRR